MNTTRFKWQPLALMLVASLQNFGAAFAADIKLTPAGISASRFQEPDGAPQNAIDGKPDTRWIAWGSGQFLTLDWGSIKTVKKLRLAFFKGAERIYTFDVLSSSDNRNFAWAGRFYSSGETGGLEAFNVTSVGRYLRIVGYENTVNQLNSITEIEAFADSGVPGPQGGTTLLDDGFESSALDIDWNPSGNDTAKIVNGIARSGTRSVLMKVSPADSVVYRTELTRADGSGRFYTGNNYCISFSVMVRDWTNIPWWNSILQFHAVPSSWDYKAGRNSLALGVESEATGPVIRFRAIKDQKKVAASSSATPQDAAATPARFGQWHDYVIRYRPSKSDDGVIQVWTDGALLYSQVGRPNMDLYDSGGFPTQNVVYMKIGIYKARDDVGTQNVFYDNVKVVRNPTSCGVQ